MKLEKTPLMMLIFIAVLVFKLLFIYQTPYYTLDSYFNIRQIENIRENFSPVFDDELSYSGKENYFSPVFHYMMAFLTIISGTAKFVHAFFISLLVLIVYLLCRKITEDRDAALLAAMMSAMIPVLTAGTLNKYTELVFTLPLMFYLLYCLTNLKDRRYTNRLIAISFLLPLIHPIALVASFSLLVYALLAYVEHEKMSRRKKEAITFFIFLSILIQFIIYKEIFLQMGATVIWQNIPSQIITSYFKQVNILDVVLQIGFLPLIFGIIGVIFGVFKEKKENVIMLTGVIVVTFLLLVLVLINFTLGLIITGITLATISSLALEKFFKYIRLTKFSKFEAHIKALLVVLIVLFMGVPMYAYAKDAMDKSLSEEEYEALVFLGRETDEGVVVSTPEEGYLINAIAKRKNVIDNNFLGASDIDQRYDEVRQVFTSKSRVKVVEILNKYNVNYVYFSERTRNIYEIDDIGYKDEACYDKVMDNGKVQIYKVSC